MPASRRSSSCPGWRRAAGPRWPRRWPGRSTWSPARRPGSRRARGRAARGGGWGAAGGPGPRDPALVLVTDGQVGNEDQILRLLAPRLGGVRVYTVGVDSAVNEGFLKRLAGLGGGACELV